MDHPNQHAHPRHPNQLPRTKWTRLNPDPAPTEAQVCLAHWEVEEYRPNKKEVVLRASLDKAHKLYLPWRALRDRTQWVPGWTHNADVQEDE